MTEPAQVARPALPDRPRRFRWRYYAARTAMVLLLLGVAAALATGGRPQDRLRPREGDIARERVVAPYDFRVQKDDATLRREQEAAAVAVPPLFAVDARVTEDDLTRFAAFQDQLVAAVSDASSSPEERVGRVRSLGVPLSDEAARALSAAGRARRALRNVSDWLNEILAAGVVAEKRGGTLMGYRSVTVRDANTEALRPVATLYDRREAIALIEHRARSGDPADPRAARAAVELAAPFLNPNVVQDRAETEWRRVQARGAVPSTLGLVQKDELIVDANQRVDRLAARKLTSLR